MFHYLVGQDSRTTKLKKHHLVLVSFSVVTFSQSCIVQCEELSRTIELWLCIFFCFSEHSLLLMDMWKLFIVFLLLWNRISQDRFGSLQPPQDNRGKMGLQLT